MAQPNDPIFFEYVLPDRKTTRYVRAEVRADGIELPYSPLLIPHISNGRHFLENDSLYKFPVNTSELSIIYDVFEDVGLTNRVGRYGPATDVYRLDNSGGGAGGGSEVIDAINSVIDIVTSHQNNSQIIGEVYDDEEIEGYVDTN